MSGAPRGNPLVVKSLVVGGVALVLIGLTLMALQMGEMVFWVGIVVAGLLDLGIAAVLARRS